MNKNKEEFKNSINGSICVDVDTFQKAETKLLIERVQSILETRGIVCWIFILPSKSNKNNIPITLPAIGGKDTDPNVAYEVLNYGMELFSNAKDKRT